MIPIKLTAVAANEDMGVLVWVLGNEQAVPVNYKALELNDALIDWFQPQAVYNDVITLAANEASGQGFVTEYAQDATLLDGIIFTDADADTWATIRQTDWTTNARGLINAIIERYANGRFDQFGNALPWDGLDEAIDQSFPFATADEKIRIRECGACVYEGEVPVEFSTETFIQAVDDFVVGPMRETQELFDNAGYVTRMYTNMSAHEMTLDPSFDFNPDLADVSQTHVANRFIECDSSVEFQDAPWRVELPSGLVVRGVGNVWPFEIEADEEFPATLAVREVGTSGQGTIVRDNAETIRKALDRSNAQYQLPKGCACSSTGGAQDASLFLVLAGLVGFRLRRGGR
jgi:MYXO-CTERM domain-containing protein